ncbi:MAG: DUF4065 domain-containing protein [Defluviitaleaceae bacterium]|nr:DUF4065 domain-containing protein [Defluviitaleaceae bacterium]MCL2274910.1 DUF4065 domain-containing protein [Defluviitaleaceae bacterium]
MANVFDVAEFFVEFAGQEEEGEMTQLKLNKLLYFAQGLYLAKTGKPLFNDAIEAWGYGPVVPAVYQKYKICGRNLIEADGKDVSCAFTDDEYDTLLDTMREYGKFSASYLVRKTHEPKSPWAQTTQNEVIENSLIAAYFTQNEKIIPFNETLAIKKLPTIGHRDADGFLLLPVNEDENWKI